MFSLTRLASDQRQVSVPRVAMAISTFQKLTLATCLVLCVALLLPKMLLSRGRKDAAERPEGASPTSADRDEFSDRTSAASHGYGFTDIC